MEAVGVDLMQVRAENWLILVDRYSGYAFAHRLHRTDSATVISFLDDTFLRHGYPLAIRCDGGPQFRDKFANYCSDKDIRYELASAYNPRSNGLAESAVKQVKYLLLKCYECKEPFQPAFYALRSTPRADGFSPFSMFFNRHPRLPGLPTLEPRHFSRETAEEARLRQAMRTAASSAAGSKTARTLQVGEPVLMMDMHTGRWQAHGVIREVRTSGRSYLVASEGTTYLRNRQHLKPAPDRQTSEAQPTPPAPAAAQASPPSDGPATRTRSRTNAQQVNASARACTQAAEDPAPTALEERTTDNRPNAVNGHPTDKGGKSPATKPAPNPSA